MTGRGAGRLAWLQGTVRALHGESFFSFMSAQSLATALGFLTLVFLARILPRSEFGLWVYVFGILQLFLLLSGLGAQAAILRFCSIRRGYARLGTLYQALRIGVTASLALVVAIVLASRLLPLRIDGAGDLLLLLALLPLPAFLVASLVAYNQAASRAGDAAAMLLTAGIVQAAATVGLAWLAGLPGVVLGHYLGPLAGLAAVAWRTRRWPRVPLVRRLMRFGPEARQLLRFGLVSTSANVASTVLVVMDTLAIGLVLGSSEAVATYKVAAIVPLGLLFLPQAVMQFLIPRFARRSGDRRHLAWMLRRLLAALVPISALLAGGIFVAAPRIVGVLVGRGYADVTDDIVAPMRILAFGFFVSATLRIPFGNVLFAVGRVGFNLANSVVTGLVNVVLNLWLVAALGSIGAAAGTVAVIVLSSLASGACLWWHLRPRNGPDAAA